MSTTTPPTTPGATKTLGILNTISTLWQIMADQAVDQQNLRTIFELALERAFDSGRKLAQEIEKLQLMFGLTWSYYEPNYPYDPTKGTCDQLQAFAQGWGIFHDQIQRVDNPEDVQAEYPGLSVPTVFANDAEAKAWVEQKAIAGDPLCRKAVLYCVASGCKPEEFTYAWLQDPDHLLR